MLPLAAVNDRQRVFTPTFALLAGAALCFFLGFGILIPVLPQYLTSLDARPVEVGIALGAVSATAIVARPLVGREVDRQGRKLFVLLGLGLSSLACLVYPLASLLWVVVAVRLIHGIALASFYPGASTFTADIAPPGRRAETLSLFSMSLHGGSAAGPTLGEYLVAHWGFSVAFQAAAVLGGIGFLLALKLREPARQAWPHSRMRLLNRAVAFPSAVLGLAALSWAALAFVPLYLAGGRGRSGFFYLVMSITIVVLRPFVGKAADRFSRSAVIIPGILFSATSMATIALGTSVVTLVAGAVLFGLGWGALFPGLFTLAIDRVPEWERGSATGTFTAAFDLSFGVGQALLGLILDLAGFRMLFSVAAAGTTIALVAYLTLRRRSEARFPALEA